MIDEVVRCAGVSPTGNDVDIVRNRLQRFRQLTAPGAELSSLGRPKFWQQILAHHLFCDQFKSIRSTGAEVGALRETAAGLVLSELHPVVRTSSLENEDPVPFARAGVNPLLCG
eukprot:scpid102577/ scgid18596/ 